MDNDNINNNRVNSDIERPMAINETNFISPGNDIQKTYNTYTSVLNVIFYILLLPLVYVLINLFSSSNGEAVPFFIGIGVIFVYFVSIVYPIWFARQFFRGKKIHLAFNIIFYLLSVFELVLAYFLVNQNFVAPGFLSLLLFFLIMTQIAINIFSWLGNRGRDSKNLIVLCFLIFYILICLVVAFFYPDLTNYYSNNNSLLGQTVVPLLPYSLFLPIVAVLILSFTGVINRLKFQWTTLIIFVILALSSGTAYYIDLSTHKASQTNSSQEDRTDNNIVISSPIMIKYNDQLLLISKTKNNYVTAMDYVSQESIMPYALSPDGRKLCFSSSARTPQGWKSTIYIKDLSAASDNMPSNVVTTVGDIIYSIVWSTDGKKVAMIPNAEAVTSKNRLLESGWLAYDLTNNSAVDEISINDGSWITSTYPGSSLQEENQISSFISLQNKEAGDSNVHLSSSGKWFVSEKYRIGGKETSDFQIYNIETKQFSLVTNVQRFFGWLLQSDQILILKDNQLWVYQTDGSRIKLLDNNFIADGFVYKY